MKLRIGIDVACKAAHQASCTDETGNFLFSGHRFMTTPADLQALWARLPEASEVLVVLEPTRNAWVALAAWMRAHGAQVVLVPPEQSADLRDYYHKHTKNDRLDSRVLARLPLLHPEGLRTLDGDQLGPAAPLQRAARRRRALVKRRTATYARIEALLELMGPQWTTALNGSDFGKAALTILAKGLADPHALKRLGRKRLTALLIRASRGSWRAERAEAVFEAAEQTLHLWAAGGLDFAELAADLAGEARQALHLSEEIDTCDERLDVLYDEADPDHIIISGPGLATTSAAAILAGLGNPDRFASLSGVRSFTGLVPALDASGLKDHHGPPTKAGDPMLRETLFNAADRARKIDPTLAARYHRLVLHNGKHHNSALCHLAAIYVTRLAACWRHHTPYQLRDTDGRHITETEGKDICSGRYKVTDADRARNRAHRASRRLKQRKDEPTQSGVATRSGSRPVPNHPTHPATT